MLQFLLYILFSIHSYAAIYGVDQRSDISKLPSRWQKTAQAVALSLPTLYLEEFDEDHYTHIEKDDRAYGEALGLCKGEKFFDQKSFGHCSAFLIHPKILVTAGHCFLPTGEVENFKHSYCENFSFWLGYNDTLSSIPQLGELIPKKNVVHCKNVIYATNNQEMEPEKGPVDFAIFELEEEVTHITPLRLAKRQLRKGEMITTIGHPHGLPAKQSGLTPVLDVFSTTLSANMDTLAGNSGGPAFNMNNEVVGILITGHQHDTYRPNGLSCDRINRCNQKGSRCNRGSELENSNLLLRNEVWMPYIQDYLDDSQKDLKKLTQTTDLDLLS